MTANVYCSLCERHSETVLEAASYLYLRQTYQHSCLVAVMSDSFVAPWTGDCQSPLSVGFSKQENWSGLPFPPPGDLPDPGIKLRSPAYADGFFTVDHRGSPY